MKKQVSTLITLLIFICAGSQARIYYSYSTGNWNNSGTWSTVSFVSAVNSGTFPSSNDTVYINNGITVTVNTNSSAGLVVIGQGISGSLIFGSSANYTLTINQNVTVAVGANFGYNSNNKRTHNLNLHGNFTNNGNVNFYFDNNDRVNLTFLGAGTKTVSGIGVWDLNDVNMNLTSRTDILDIANSDFENALRTISFTVGTYIHSNSSTFSVDSTNDYTIVPNVTIKVTSGVMKFASDRDQLYLQGGLIIDGGTVYVGDSQGKKGIRTDKISTIIPRLEINSGLLNIKGGIIYRNSSATEALEFYMAGGTLLLNNGSPGTSNELFKISDVSSSIFQVTGGSIIFQNPNTSGVGSKIDLAVCGTNGTVNCTGGEIRFGNSSTQSSATFNFQPFANVCLPKIFVDGPNGNSVKLMPCNGAASTDHYCFLGLQINTGNTFDNRSISGTNGDGKTMFLKQDFTNNGTFTPRTGSVTFNGTALQYINGSINTTFYNLEVNKSVQKLTISTPTTVSNLLTLTLGNINTTVINTLTIGSAGTSSLGSSSSYVEGPFINQVAQSGSKTLYFPIGADGFYRPAELVVNHNSTASVSYWSQMVNSPAAGLIYALPVDLSRVSLKRYWQFVRTGASNFVNSTIKLYYGTDDGVNDFNSLRVATGSVLTWLNLNGVGTANNSGSIVSGTFTTFNSIFTLGNAIGGNNTLPVSWLAFTVKSVERINRLNWSTASEVNCANYEVQRSKNGIDFYTIGSLDGAGTVSSTTNYEFIDSEYSTGKIFYRIKQNDIDGNSDFSVIRTAQFNPPDITINPTIAANGFVELYTNENIQSSLVIFNAVGSIAKNIELNIQQGQKINIETEFLPSGIYIVAIPDLGFSRKIIIP